MKMLLCRVVLVFFGIFASVSNAKDIKDIRTAVPFLNDLPPLNDYKEQLYFVPAYAAPDPGVGWNSYTSEHLVNTCVTGVKGSPIPIQSKQDNIQIIRDMESFYSSLDLSVGGSYGAFSGSGSFRQSLKKTRDEQLIVANVDRAVAATEWRPLQNQMLSLTESAKKLLKSKGNETKQQRVQRFREACGDSYITRVIDGVFWIGRFSYKQSTAEMQEEIELKAKGNFAVGSVSASAKSRLEKNISAENSTVTSSQLGGGTTKSVTTGAEMQVAYKSITSDPLPLTPYKIKVRSYRSSGIEGWPADLKDISLPTVSSLQILGHSERLDDLAAIYRDAAVEPKNYYFPFTDGSNLAEIRQSLANASDALSHSAACLRTIEAYCLVKSVCSTDVIKDASFVTQACPALKDSSQNFGLKVKNLIFGSDDANIKKVIADNLFKVIPQETNRQKKITKQTIDVAEGNTPAYTFYEYLAASPMRRDRVRNDTGEEVSFNLSDDVFSFTTYCNALKIPCSDAHLNNANADEQIKKYLRDWTLKIRVMPVANSFQKNEHPMKVPTASLLGLTDVLPVTLGEERNFTDLKKPPPPPIATPAPATKPPYRQPHCGAASIRYGSCGVL